MAEQAQRSQPNNKPATTPGRVFTVTCTLPQFLFIFLFGLVSITWIFIFGVMLGRGHKPEDSLPRLAKAMPSPIAGDTIIAPPPPADVLQPDELHYHNTLKGRPATSAMPSTPASKQNPPKTASPQDTAGAMQPSPPSASVEKKEQPKQTVKQAAAGGKYSQENAKNTPPPVPPDSFDYVYQVAAFTTGPQAETLKNKLQAAGLKTSIEKQQVGATTWHKLLVFFRGRPEDITTIKNTLAKQGITHILLRSKKPLS